MAHQAAPLQLDAAIFGGGAAGLWLLNELVRRGQRALLFEAGDLGHGQTVASQGIIHGGLKYSLGGLLTPSGRMVRDMPVRWRRSLAGEMSPDLRNTRLRAEFCHLWRTDSLGGRVGLLGARLGLRVAPAPLAPEARPALLASAPAVWRLDEQVIEPPSFLSDLAYQHRTRLLQIDAAHGLEFVTDGPGRVSAIRLIGPDSGTPLDVKARWIVLAAGAGNEDLRRRLGLDARAMQRRPLHMVLMRGPLPTLNAHCVDGATTRLTITTSWDCEDRIVWQVGGHLAERGVGIEPEQLLEEARREVRACLPDLELSGVQWATHTVDRAEARTGHGARPDRPFVEVRGNTLTTWPTKLALVPRLAELTIDALDLTAAAATDPPAPDHDDPPRGFPRPTVALPPWEHIERWIDD